MKKVISFALCFLMALSLCIPALAEGNAMEFPNEGYFPITEDRELSDLSVSNSGAVLHINPNVTVTVTGSFRNSGCINIDGTLVVNGDFDNSGVIDVSGTLIVNGDGENTGKINVRCCGTFEGELGGNAPVCAEHVFNNGSCTQCRMKDPSLAEGAPVEAVPGQDGGITIPISGDYIISVDRVVAGLNVMNSGAVLTIAPNVTVTVTGDLMNFGTLNVDGTLIVTRNGNNPGTIRVGCGGTIEGRINVNAPIYEEHSFNDSGVCEKCGIHKICFEGEHEYDDNGLCEYCGAVSDSHEHDFTTGQCVCGMLCPHDEWNEASCAACGYECPHEAERDNGFCTVCGCLVDEASHTHDFTDGDCLCGAPAPEAETETTPEPEAETASVLSEGSLWIVLAVAVLAVCGVAALVVTKKKKPALASGAEKEDEE